MTRIEDSEAGPAGMVRPESESVSRQIELLCEGGSVAGMTDRQLLERFAARRDDIGEVAFSALVARHGPMVLGICRQLVGDLHHAEDAFQAVFLVLARKAKAIRDPDLLGNWLYGVAQRTARKARVRLARQRKNEEGDAMRRPGSGSSTPAEAAALSSEDHALAGEEAETLHNEIARLPRPFRLPVVLCYFEGLTLDEAARRLRWPAGTLRSRLARARDKLRVGLTRRGVVLPAAVLAAAASPKWASAQISSPLCEITTKAAIEFASGQGVCKVATATVTALAHEVLKAMLLNKLRFAALTILAIGALATGVGFLSHSLAMMPEEPKARPAARQTLIAAVPKQENANQDPGPGQMIVLGRVLDPQGKLVPNAATMVYALLKKQLGGVRIERGELTAIGAAQSDGAGQFRINTPRTSSARYDQFGAVAIAPGYGAGWVQLDPDAGQPTGDIPLRPERVIQGRLVDQQGQPAQGVEVTVTSMGRLAQGSVDRNPMRERMEAAHFWSDRVKDLSAWPKPATTDADGRFTIRGVGRDLRIFITITDSRYAHQRIPIDTNSDADAKQVSVALEPAKTITGRVTFAKTDKPAPRALVQVWARKTRALIPPIKEFETDADGRFRANSSSGDHFDVVAYPPEGQPYLTAEKGFDWTKGEAEHSVDMALPLGVMIRGKITEQGSGKPIEGANVTFQSRSIPGADAGDLKYSHSDTRPAGSFQFAVLPRPGYLSVRGPSDDYLAREMGTRMLAEGQPGGFREYSHAYIFVDLNPASTSQEIDISLRRGEPLHGRVVGPDGQPIQDASMISRLIRLGGEPGRRWRASYHGAVRNGRFELHGLDPDTEVPVFFLEPKGKLGAMVNFSGKSAAGGPITVRLEPCGTATARLVDPEGNPLGGFRDSALIWMVITPGPPRSSLNANPGRLIADEGTQTAIDPANYGNGPASDAKGRIAFPALIPGATYRILVLTTNRDPAGYAIVQLRKEFTVKPGETVDLGDVRIEKRER